MVETIAPRLEGVLVVFLVLTWVSTALRFYVRCFISKGWGTDDSLLVAALVCFTIYCSCAFAGIALGIGRHRADIPLEDIPPGMMFWWLFQIFFITCSVLLRCSIAVFILRICQKRTYKLIIYATTGMVIVFSIFYLCLLIFQCHPVSLFWNQYVVTQSTAESGGGCLDIVILQSTSYIQCVVSALADWVLGILPLWLIWNLKMNLRTKLSVGVLLSFGMIAGIIAITRVPFILKLSSGDDFSYIAVDMAIWSIIEPGLGIVATACCVLRPLMKRFYGSSGYGTHQVENTNNYPSKLYNRDVDTTRSNTRGYEIKNNDIEMEGVVTSVLPNRKGERGREWSRKIHGSGQKNGIGNESEEELTKDGIFVHKMVEISVQEEVVGQKREESMGSVNSEL